MGDIRVQFVRLTMGFILAATPALADPLKYESSHSKVEIVEGPPRTITIERTAPSQEEVSFYWHVHFNDHCVESVETSFEILKPPRHGIICYRVAKGVVRIESRKATSPSCLGASTLGRAVYYRPSGPFIGQDSEQFQVLHGERRVLYGVATATIILTPPLSPPPAQTEATTSVEEDEQAPGPMPRCPDLVSQADTPRKSRAAI
jgi:hypothetical protein